MDDFCYILLANGVLASVLALAVWLLCMRIKRPALVHLLWVLVLLRLIVPPLLSIDVRGVKVWIASTAKRSAWEQGAFVRERIADQSQLLMAITKAIQGTNVIPQPSVLPASDRVAITDPSTEPTIPISIWAATTRSVALLFTGITTFLFPTWLFGTLACVVIQIQAAVRFRRTVRRHSYSSRIWQRRLVKVADRMELDSCPQLMLVRAKISPMLWGFGHRACILFPEKLLLSLDKRGQDTLLAHELAHYRRGDQWVRLLELVATAVFWWHPVLWWARNEIEKAEEHCCDSWAVRQSNGRPRTYAEALLATVDFVSTPSLPPIASGANRSNFLRCRIRTVMSERLVGRKTLLPNSYPSVAALAVLVLVPYPAFWAAASVAPLRAPVTQGQRAPVAVEVRRDQFGQKQIPSNVLEHAETEQPLTLMVDEAQRATFVNRPLGVHVDLGVGAVASASFSNDAELLAIGTMDGVIQIVDCNTGKVVKRFDVTHAAVSSVSFSPDDQQLAVGTRDGICKLVDLTRKGREEAVRRRLGASVSSIRFSNDGRFAAVVWVRRSRQHVEFWDLVSGRISALTPPDRTVVAAVDASDGEKPAWHLVHKDGSLSLWDGHQIARLERTVPVGAVQNLRVASSPGTWPGR